MGGLDEDRQPQLTDLAQNPGGLGAPARFTNPYVVDLRNGRGGRGQQALEHDLVHADRRSGDARADIGDVKCLEQPLDDPVLAERTVQRSEHDVSAEQTLPGTHAHGLIPVPPSSVAVDLDRDHLVTARKQAFADRGARGERDLVLG